jgi:hypothetical protein
MKNLLQPLLLSFFTCISLISSATTIHVPGDSATIQAAINGALDGDTVLVAPGTYTGDGIYWLKVVSSNGCVSRKLLVQ